MEKKTFRLSIQSLYLLCLLPILGAVTLVMGIKIHTELYNNIERGFDRKLSAISLVVGAFIDGEKHDELLRPRTVVGLTYVDSRSTLYGIDQLTGQLLTINPQHGTPRVIGAPGFAGLTALAYDSTHNSLYGVNSQGDQLVVLDLDTGKAQRVGSVGIPCRSLAFHPKEGKLYAAGANWVCVNPHTGERIIRGSLEGAMISGLVYDDQRRQFLALDDAAKSLIAVDPETAHIQTIGILTAAPKPSQPEPTPSAEEKTQDQSEKLKELKKQEEIKQKLERISEWDRVRRTGTPEEIADIGKMVEDVVRYTAEAAKLKTETADDTISSETKTISFRGLAWNPNGNQLFSSTDRLITIDPQTAVYREVGWWADYHSELSDAYLDYILPMRRIWKKLDITYLTTFRRPEGGTIDDEVYVLDIDYGKTHVPIGYQETFQPGEGRKIYGTVFTGGIYTSGIVNWGEWGLLKSGYAPIYDAGRQVRGVASADIDVSIIATKTRIALLNTVGIGLLAFMIAGVVVISLTRTLLRPIYQLQDKSLIVAAGGYGETAPPQGPVEFGALFEAFNRLSQKLKNFFEERTQADQKLLAQSARLKLTHILKRESETAARIDSHYCAGFALGIAKDTQDLSGSIQQGSGIIAWAGALKGDSLNAAKVKQEIILITILLLKKYGRKWEAISAHLCCLYPDSLFWFCFLDHETGETEFFLRRPAYGYAWDADQRCVVNLQEIQPGILQEGQALIVSSTEISLLPWEEKKFPDFTVSGAEAVRVVLKTALQKTGNLHDAFPQFITILARPKL